MRRRVWTAPASILAVALASSCVRADRVSPEKLRQQIKALEEERETLRTKMDGMLREDPLLVGMPKQPVLVGVPTSLAGELIKKVTAAFVDQVTLELKNLKVKKTGTVKKVITLGDYDLQVEIHRITGKLQTGTPDVTFGGNKVSLALPVTVASGTGKATIHFDWKSKSVSGAVCSDMSVSQVVEGKVVPARYAVSGGLVLTASVREILATPRFPLIKVNLKVDPSAETWAAVQKILEDKTGLCGYVLEKVDVLGIVQGLIERGFNIRLPTEKIKAVAVPVGIAPTMVVKGQPVELGITVGDLAITDRMIWLGADVKVAIPDTEPTLAPAKAAPASSTSPHP